MRLPKAPPRLQSLLEKLTREDPEVFLRLTEAGRGPMVNGRYRHWHRLQFLKPPAGLTHEAWWAALRLSRRWISRPLPLADAGGVPFTLAMVDPVLEMLHEIDSRAGKTISTPGGVVLDETVRERHIVSSLMEEAITSSQLEGAATTRDVAKEMLRSGRAPRTYAERMIHNNYATIRWLRDRTAADLTPSLICEIHARMTRDTLDDAQYEGHFRRTDDIRVRDLNEIVHQPPPAADLVGRIESLCAFANGEQPAGFLHPVIRAIVLHFGLAYEHPFVDGNGRTARALFYWSMLRSGHWICEFLPISRIFLQSPSRYARAFLYTESDENDLTYFVLFHLDGLLRALGDLHSFLEVRKNEQSAVRKMFAVSSGLNDRQLALLSHAREHAEAEYTIAAHQESHGVVYQTARTDLMDLESRGLLTSTRVGRRLVYQPSRKLAERLTSGRSARKTRSKPGRD